MLKMENLPLLHQFLPTFWCDRFDKMVEEVAGSAVFHSFSFFFGHIFPKMRPYLSVGFLILSAGFLILLASALIVSADAIRIFAFRKAEWFDPSLLCEDLWFSWEEKSKKIIDIFKPTNFQKGAPSISPMRGSAQLWFSDWSDLSDLSEIQSSD